MISKSQNVSLQYRRNMQQRYIKYRNKYHKIRQSHKCIVTISSYFESICHAEHSAKKNEMIPTYRMIPIIRNCTIMNQIQLLICINNKCVDRGEM